MSYSSVWLIIIATGAVAVAAAYMLVLSRIPSVFLRALVCALLLALLLTPAPVPEYPSNYAPAFIVAVFEGVLQSGGNPWAAVRLLLVGLMVTLAAVTLATLGLRRWKRPSVAEHQPQAPGPEAR